MRRTLDNDDPILRNVRQLKKKEANSMGRTASDLLAQALRGDAGPAAAPLPVWISRPMGALVDLADKQALYLALDR